MLHTFVESQSARIARDDEEHHSASLSVRVKGSQPQDIREHIPNILNPDIALSGESSWRHHYHGCNRSNDQAELS